MKTQFDLTLFNDEKTKEKLEIMNCLEAMFDDDRNHLPNEYYFFSDGIQMGRTVRVTLELVDARAIREQEK
jgi:hypothetical protein